ncbi:MAG: MoxR family ATPase [Gracilimonas sp.]|nr:MoxR family ATPase [Gracilimonas sp.]
MEVQKLVRQVVISDDLITYVNSIVRSTRPDQTKSETVKKNVDWGAGPRAGQAMILTAKARALLNDRYSVTLDDLAFVAPAVLRHRMLLNFKAETEGISTDKVTEQLLKEIQPPQSTV